MTEPSRRVSIVVPLHDASLYTRIFLLALRDLLPSEPCLEVVLVDNGSTDDTPAVLAELARGHRVVSLPRNLGFAGGCNRGAAASRGELLFFVNNDTVPTRGFVAAAVEAVDANPRVAAVGSKLLYPGGRIQHAGVAFDRGARPFHLHEHLPGSHPAAAVPRELQCVTGAALLVRRADFEAVGGFDEGFRNSFEDLDLCLRLRERGRKILYCPRSVLYHFTASSSGRHDWDVENFRRFHERWHDRIEPDLERLRVEPEIADAAAAGAPSTTPEILSLIADARRDALASRAQVQLLEARLAAALGSPAAAGTPRLLSLECPDAVAVGSGFTARVAIESGGRPDADLRLCWSWSGNGSLPRPGTLVLSPPAASVLERAIAVEAPESPGSYELSVALADGAPPGRPQWRKTIEVRALYGAAYRHDTPPRLRAGEAAVVRVRLTNEGLVPWEGGGFRLSYHWRGLDRGLPEAPEGWRTYLHHRVGPGESVWLRARVLAPGTPGAYALEWDVVHEGVSWFSELGVPVSSSRVDVTPAAEGLLSP